MPVRSALTFCAVAALCLVLVGSPPSAIARDAEFAVRWDASAGGPRSAADTLAALGLALDDEDAYSVQYFTVVSPNSLPAEFSAIARARQKNQKKELTLKIRVPESHAISNLKTWKCELGSGAEMKDQIDVSFVGPTQVKRVFSRSCSVESKRDISFPASLKATAKGCISSMTRLKARGLKVEEWVLNPSGTRLLEVSKNSEDTGAALEDFRSQVVLPLLERRVNPIDRSKSEAGSDCS
jgi:hypothetical protein